MLKVKATDTFRVRAARLLAAAEREALYVFLAGNPTAGDIVGGTGDTVWLLDVYGKGEKADLSPADLKAIKAAVAIVKQAERT